jgi:hypothetical protein
MTSKVKCQAIGAQIIAFEEMRSLLAEPLKGVCRDYEQANGE